MQTATAQLFRAMKNERIAHAILITGPQGSDAAALARRAAAHYCLGHEDISALANCPDYIELGADTVPIGAIRELQATLAERSYSGRRAVVFLNAHRMSDYAQNALLKTLEEPPDHTLMILCGHQAGLLPTIRSRCAIVRLGAQSNDEILARLRAQGINEACAHMAVFLCEGAPLLAEAYADEAHLDFFHSAVPLFFQTLESKVPLYTETAAMLDTALAKQKSGASKAARQRPTAQFLLRIYLMLARDMLAHAHGLPVSSENPAATQVAQSCARFTIRQIQCMIDMLLTAQRRVEIANPSLTMDSLVTKFACDLHDICK